MADDLARIRDQLERSLTGPAWHGPALLEVLEGVDHEDAAARPIPDAHSIGELVGHVDTWMRVVTRRLGGDATPVTAEEDFPAVPADAAGWAEALRSLEDAGRELDAYLAASSAETLTYRTPQAGFTVLQVLDGVVQHNLYHAGQIAVLKKGLPMAPGRRPR